jgi:hypothetical protein
VPTLEYCPRCHALIEPTHEFCQSCGKRLKKDAKDVLLVGMSLWALWELLSLLKQGGRDAEVGEIQAAVADAKPAKIPQQYQSGAPSHAPRRPSKPAQKATSAPGNASSPGPKNPSSQGVRRTAQECPHVAHLECEHSKILFGDPRDLRKRIYTCANCPPGHDRQGVAYLEIAPY